MKFSMLVIARAGSIIQRLSNALCILVPIAGTRRQGRIRCTCQPRDEFRRQTRATPVWHEIIRYLFGFVGEIWNSSRGIIMWNIYTSLCDGDILNPLYVRLIIKLSFEKHLNKFIGIILHLELNEIIQWENPMEYVFLKTSSPTVVVSNGRSGIVRTHVIHYGNELCAQAADSLENHSSLQLHWFAQVLTTLLNLCR